MSDLFQRVVMGLGYRPYDRSDWRWRLLCRWSILKSRWTYWNPRWSILGPVANFLERRYPDRYCWAELVMWGMFGAQTIRDCRNVERCRAETSESPYSCYCGKYMGEERLLAHQRPEEDG